MSSIAVVRRKPPEDRPKASIPAPLFREEVLAAQETPWVGTILLEPRVSHRIAARVAVAAALALIAVLVFGSYTRKERIKGWLVPESGIARIVAPNAGIVKSLSVAEGQKVTKGQPLLVLSNDIQTETVGAAGEEVVRKLASRRETLLMQRDAEQRVADQQESEVRGRVEALTAETGFLSGEIELQRRRIELTKGNLSRAQLLRQRGIVTKTSLGNIEGEHLDQVAKLQSLERSLSQLSRELSAAKTAQSELPLKGSIRVGEIDREIAAVEQAVAEAEARRQAVIVAPQDGIVTAIQTEVGGSAAANVPLMSIVPEGSVLQAQLFAPSRAIGFIQKGGEVNLRYQPFPYQNFGFYKGHVDSVSMTAINPAELPRQLAGLSDFYGANAPVYRITVNLARQDVTAYGKKVPLQAGMQLEADILIERHRLIEWLFYPLFAKTGAWAQ